MDWSTITVFPITFQSSPCDQTGCDVINQGDHALCEWFQSSPCDQTGCDRMLVLMCAFYMHVSILTLRSNRVRPPFVLARLVTRLSFNPHPAIKQGATWERWWGSVAISMFQSSPCDQTGCDSATVVYVVVTDLFQSSPCDQTGCDAERLAERLELTCFNPHPAIKQGATRRVGAGVAGILGFNPHPAIKQGATKKVVAVDGGACCFNPHPAIKQGAT